MLKILRLFIATSVHSQSDLVFYIIAFACARNFMNDDGSFIHAILIIYGILFLGLCFKRIATAFIDARLKAKAEKEFKNKRNEAADEALRIAGIKPPRRPSPRSVTGKPPKKK